MRDKPSQELDDKKKEFGLGFWLLLLGILVLTPSVLTRVSFEGQHFIGVYGIIIGLMLIFDGIRRMVSSKKSNN